jgi:hypothetical protein
MTDTLDPNNYPAVWNEHRRLSLLHERCLESLMAEVGVDSASALEDALLELREANHYSQQARHLYSQLLSLEQELAKAEDAFAVATRIKEARETIDRDLISIEC